MPTNVENDKGTRYPCRLCLEDHVTWHCPCLQECTNYLAKMDFGKAPIVLRNPFPTQQQQNLISNQLQPTLGGNDGSQHHSSSEGSSTIHTFEIVELTTRAKSFGAPVALAAEPSLGQNPFPPNDFHIKRSVKEFVTQPLKGALRRTMHNTSAHATQY